jgi:quaternary ammonium compound-resistance protein SugE
MNAWLFLLIAGLLEIVFATLIVASKGFTRPLVTVCIIIVAVLSLYCLSQAAKTLPIGTAYAVWTGIGAAGTAIIGIFFMREPTNFFRIVSLLLIVSGVIGLKLTETPK